MTRKVTREETLRPASGIWLLIAASVAVAAIAAGAVYFLLRPKPAPPPLAAVEPALAPGTEVSFSGTVQARNVVLVPAPIEGTLENVEVETGHEVFEGQLLARIKNTSLESSKAAAMEVMENAQSRVNNLESALIAARLEASRASAEASRARLEFEKAEKLALRQQMLLREGATARVAHDKAQKDFQGASADHDAMRSKAKMEQERVESLVRDLESARKKLEEASTQLEAATADLTGAEVLSPVDGVLTAMRATSGDAVTMDILDLFQIGVDPGQLQVAIDPDPRVKAKLRAGLPALVQVLELSRDGVEGEVKFTEEGKVLVEFSTADPYLRPGLSAIVKIKLP
ncbi:MAG: hypothetical protein JJE04_27615 [Acidobacteriia bacterium]|nr:hypothetical protein [Terriglobia bacterium]